MNQTNASRRTFQKVRRDSKLVGTCEKDLWRATDNRQMRLALRAAERYDKKHKPKGKRNGPLGYTGLLVLRALWLRIRFDDGCLCPSIQWIMNAARLSRGAVVAALKRLKLNGFVTWRRRLEYVGGPPGVRGPQVKQATNAYALGLPGRALQAELEASTAPLTPADELHRRREREAFEARCQREAFLFSPLADAFARLQAALFNNASLPSARNPDLGLSLSKASGPAGR
jgi:hypothetical protein